MEIIYIERSHKGQILPLKVMMAIKQHIKYLEHLEVKQGQAKVYPMHKLQAKTGTVRT